MNTIQRIFTLAYTALTAEERAELTRLLKKMAIAVIAGTGILVAISSYLQPAKVVEDKVAEPALQAFSVIHTQCPDGWQANKPKDGDTKVLSCERTVQGVKYLVVLTPEGEFDYAIPLDVPGARIIEDESAVPGW